MVDCTKKYFRCFAAAAILIHALVSTRIVTIKKSYKANLKERKIDLSSHHGHIPTPAPSLFLGYAAHDGWSNQVICLKHAYLVARATGRALITAPGMDHSNRISKIIMGGHYKYGVAGRFVKDIPLYALYQTNAKVSLDKVLDLEYTLPNVTTMTYEKFWTQYFANESANLTQWVMETEYNHAKDTFTYQRPDLENLTVSVKKKETRYRDLAVIAKKQSNKQLWTLLDAYMQTPHTSVLMDERMNKSLTQTGTFWSTLNFRYSHIIRQAGQMIHQEVWDGIPYASMHVRTGDGIFFNPKRVESTRNQAIQRHKAQLEKWIKETIASNGILPPKIGLFVATDMKSDQLQQFSQELMQQVEPLLVERSMTMQIMNSSSFGNYTRQLKKSLVFPDIFLDQQLAGCATIDFVGSSRSTFSQLIQNIRASPGACDV